VKHETETESEDRGRGSGDEPLVHFRESHLRAARAGLAGWGIVGLVTFLGGYALTVTWGSIERQGDAITALRDQANDRVQRLDDRQGEYEKNADRRISRLEWIVARLQKLLED